MTLAYILKELDFPDPSIYTVGIGFLPRMVLKLLYQH
jgi:hypothetical protein